MLAAFTERLAACLLQGRAPAVVGLDPRPQHLPAGLLPDAPVPDAPTPLFPDAPIMADAAEAVDAASATLAVYLEADLTPHTFSDGLSGQTPQDYRVGVRRFERVIPTLHQIFVDRVGRHEAEIAARREGNAA